MTTVVYALMFSILFVFMNYVQVCSFNTAVPGAVRTSMSPWQSGATLGYKAFGEAAAH